MAHATVSMRGFPQVLFAAASSGRPAMPRDDGGRPSPPDIGGVHACVYGQASSGRRSQSRGRATVSQRGFPHVAQATVSIRGFPRVLFTGLLRPPAMPEDDGGRPSPPDIGVRQHACV